MPNYDLSGNSFKSKNDKAKQEKPKLKPVVQEAGQIREASFLRKGFNAFFPEAVGKRISSFILQDLLVPVIKTAIGTILISGGKNISSQSGTIVAPGKTMNYNNYYNGGNAKGHSLLAPPKTQGNIVLDHEHVWYSSMADAKRVIDEMNTVLQSYPVVTVSDMKEISNMSREIVPNDNNLGWYNLTGVRWYSDRGGCTVIFPPCQQL